MFAIYVTEKKKEEKEKKEIDISPIFGDRDFYRSTKYSRWTVFGILYTGRNFRKVKIHQPHQEDFMPYLEILVSENPTWASDTGLEDMKWQTLVQILKTMWIRYRIAKNLKHFQLSLGYVRTIYDSYSNFEE